MNIFRLDVVGYDLVEILKFLPVTLEIAVIAMITGLAFGFVLALFRMKQVPLIKQIIGFFISFIRGTPIIVQLYATYFGIPILLQYINYYRGSDYQAPRIEPIIYAIVALALNQAAYNAVTIQSAIEAVNKGEIEAATSIGMNSFQKMTRIILPEATELAIPSLGNNLIGLIKGTSLAFSCGVIEIAAQGKILAGRNYRYFESYVALAIIYWVLTIVLEQVFKRIVNAVKVPETPKIKTIIEISEEAKTKEDKVGTGEVVA
ncbi:MAG: amino acid ABC transporter permease [Butyrivibrio sp.]|nr:amino acid ABC transporter permease [Butyrivibrio sp.]